MQIPVSVLAARLVLGLKGLALGKGCLFLLAAIPFQALAQTIPIDQYKKALWMTTRFYGGQRSGEGPNWLVMDHKGGKDFVRDADGDYSLAGGWHDCGDHVKYGQTQFYSGYMLLKAFAEFPSGFDDHYGFDYRGYRESGDFSWEGRQGKPNGIPDILDEAKYATDYFIRCARSGTVFYNQVGDGQADHRNWVTSVHMASLPAAEGGQVRKVFKNPADASMPSFCGAALSLMSRLYRKFDPAYADLCLRHARFAHAYAKAHPNTEGTKDGPFYPANARWQDDYAILATELYWATGEAAFLEEAKGMADKVEDHHYSLCYNNADDLAAYNLALLGLSDKAALLQKIVDRYKANVTQAGVGNIGNGWGRLRFPMNQAFAAGLLAKLKAVPGAFSGMEVDPFTYKNLDYVLGANAAGQSFIVGFGEKSPQKPHHRNVYLSDANTGSKNSLVIPLRNRQAGILMGGTLVPGEYKDDVESYTHTEGCIDYNAGLVASLGYVLSVKAPVDTALFPGTSSIPSRPRGKAPESKGQGTALWVDGLGRLIRLPESRPASSSRDAAIGRWPLP